MLLTGGLEWLVLYIKHWNENAHIKTWFAEGKDCAEGVMQWRSESDKLVPHCVLWWELPHLSLHAQWSVQWNSNNWWCADIRTTDDAHVHWSVMLTRGQLMVHTEVSVLMSARNRVYRLTGDKMVLLSFPLAFACRSRRSYTHISFSVCT